MSGNTALCCASNFGHAAAVELLLQKGANINHQNDNGCTALMYASQHGFFQVTEVLLKHEGCLVDAISTPAHGCNTALIIAAYSDGHAGVGEERKENISYEKVIGLLIGAGADPKLLNFNGASALDCAAYSDRNRGTKLLAAFSPASKIQTPQAEQLSGLSEHSNCRIM